MKTTVTPWGESMRKLSIFAFAVGLVLTPIGTSAQLRQANLPDGVGKDLVEGLRTGCHSANQIVRSSGYTEEEWAEHFSSMVDFADMAKERSEIAQYLAANMPPDTTRAPTLVPGDLEVGFTEWKVPTLGQRARDPVEAPDGTIWWVGQWGNLIGRIDPTTGEMNEYPLPADAMPHSVTIDEAGMVWYTGNQNGSVGKFDPTTEEITVYPMPDPAARDPHTAVFDADGILWFTLQRSNMVGRLDPATGEVHLVTAPTQRARPYGIKIDADGVPWVACNGSNCLLKVDPATMELTEVKLPIPQTTVRRLDIADDGMIWYVNSSQGRLGRYNPQTGEIAEWPSPSGPDSHPYGLACAGGAIWYNESGMRPDALVRFDPATETFQSWAIPSDNVHGGIVRHMRTTRDGNLLIHQASTNRIILVTLPQTPATK